MMIEKIVLDYLEQNTAVLVSTEKRSQSGKYIVIEKVGGGETNHIKRASIAVQSYADTMYEAAELNETVKALMQGIVALGSVSSCRLDTDYNFTDTISKKYRYQAVFDLVHY